VRWFEDLVLGEGGVYGSWAITQDEIVEFATRYDPQPFHVDPEAARGSIYGGLIASGLQSTAIASRLIIDGWLTHLAAMGSPGLEAMALRNPVRPGDVLRARIEVIELRPSRSRPDLGIVRYILQLLNQRDELILDTVAVIFVRRREPAAS
jgi:acyl dehydratase